VATTGGGDAKRGRAAQKPGAERPSGRGERGGRQVLAPVYRSLAFVPLTPSALPVGAMGRTLSWATRSRRPISIFVSTSSCAPRTHAYFAAPVSSGAASKAV